MQQLRGFLGEVDFRAMLDRNRANWILLLAGFNYYLVHCFALESSFAASALHDDGYIQVGTILLIFAAQALAVWQLFGEKAVSARILWLMAIYVLEIYALREADLHHQFTEINITKGKFYLAESIPLHQKLIAGGILFPAFIFMGVLLLARGLVVLRKLLSGTSWAMALVLWGGILFLAQVMDRIGCMNESPQWRIHGIEEFCEMMAAACMLACLVQYALARRRAAPDGPGA